MVAIDIKDDLRQAVVIAKNEITKYIRGRRIFIIGILTVIILGLFSALPYLLGESYSDPTDVALTFTAFYTFILELAAVLFAATTIVSEFEDRTALVLFTKPVRKWSIFIGKFMACFLILTALVVIYLGYTMAFSMVATGDVAPGFGTAFLLSFAACFGLIGLGMLISSFAKKGSTAIILTLILLIILLGTISSLLLTFADVDSWWCLTDCINAITFNFGAVGDISMTDSEITRAGIVMVVWGIVCSVLAFLLFRKREF
ncbi:MAG: hypothetical protein E7Z63_00220 [Thermoplasmata archaeon]|nr:hypothetical protein [Thermoplasmata archaeon]